MKKRLCWNISVRYLSDRACDSGSELNSDSYDHPNDAGRKNQKYSFLPDADKTHPAPSLLSCLFRNILLRASLILLTASLFAGCSCGSPAAQNSDPSKPAASQQDPSASEQNTQTDSNGPGQDQSGSTEDSVSRNPEIDGHLAGSSDSGQSADTIAVLSDPEALHADLMKTRQEWNLSYGTRPWQKLDLYLPKDGNGPFPFVMFIHGGSWNFGDKADDQFTPFKQLLDHGYALASINYALLSDENYPAGLRDCVMAAKYLTDNAKTFDLNPEAFFIAGDSSGGHYALLLGLSQGLQPFWEEPDKHIILPAAKGVVAWYPVTDLNSLSGQLNIYAQSVFGPVLNNMDPALLQQSNATYWIALNDMPVLLQHGTQDELVFIDQANLLNSISVNKANDQLQLEYFEGAEHRDPDFETPENLAHIADWMNGILQRQN